MPVFKRRRLDDPTELPSPESGAQRNENGYLPGAAPASPMTADTGLGVPAFRPGSRPHGPAPITAPAFKEIPMGRSPFAAAPPPPPPPGPSLTVPGRTASLQPIALPAQDSAERRTLVVGRGISVQGTVQDAERLVVEGTVEATMIQAAELAISPGGVFRGEVEVENAEVAGTIDGTLTVRGNLVVRATGRVLGTARCRRLQVEDGGQITGRIEMITDFPVRAVEPSRAPAEVAE